MKIYIQSYGDPSIGIFPSGATVDLPDWLSGEMDTGNRKDLRVEFQEFFTKIFDDKVTILFDDECPDCGNQGFKDGKCSREDCVQNFPDEEPTGEVFSGEEIPFS